MISEETRQFVQQRASQRCEYCLSHQHYVMGKLQVDHIHPVAKGGVDDLDNLCLACELCNQYKWTRTHGLDPLTRTQAPLFNPRTQKWSDHFRWSEAGDKVIGRTASGRATVMVLHLNSDLAVTVRRNWVRAGWHPPNP